MISALFVQRGGCYWYLPGVDAWDEERDARLYAGPYPVVAHPPCSRWCQMARVNQARYGHRIGEDGGCFAAALAAVRQWGGVLEHPAYSLAWAAHGLPRPNSRGGWINTQSGGWTCQVEQGHYGHAARKKTWLYAHSLEPPDLRWGPGPAPTAWISTDRTRAELAARGLRQIAKREAQATPTEFRDLLIHMARSVWP